jgi:hypothetical protein
MGVDHALRLVVIACCLSCSGPSRSEKGAQVFRPATAGYGSSENARVSCACTAGARCEGQEGPRVCSDGGAWAFPGRYFPPLSCQPGGVLGEHCLGGDYSVCAYSSSACTGPLDWLECSDRVPDAGPDSGWIWLAADTTCSAQCPKSSPPDGSPCAIEPMFCGWPSACGANDYAFCEQGQWKVTLSSCACADPSHAMAGTACTSAGAVCIEPNPAPNSLPLRIATCSGGRWTAAAEKLGSHCPPLEPMADAPCSSGDECAWENACGGWTSGTCTTAGVWRKSASACPGTALQSCSAGTACEPRSTCMTGGCQYVICNCTSSGTLQCQDAVCPN